MAKTDLLVGMHFMHLNIQNQCLKMSRLFHYFINFFDKFHDYSRPRG